eukprot:TRINITY_DN53340_c0_g1_i1.p1 TRINITY_DN53340_c0_g1~~TRINITY_DN53340_c0_g1_i1.p1  ORF type:complete len:364 (-),score=-9.34 TRINITY_DN53340_c0_g1_i1:36-1055(-)
MRTPQCSVLLNLPDEVLLVIAEYVQLYTLSHVCSRLWANLQYKYLVMSKIPYKKKAAFYAFWQSNITVAPPGLHTLVLVNAQGPTVHDLTQIVSNSLATLHTLCTVLTLAPADESKFYHLLSTLSALRVLKLQFALVPKHPHLPNCTALASVLQGLSTLEELVLDVPMGNENCLAGLPTGLCSLSINLQAINQMSWLVPLDNLRTLSLRALVIPSLADVDFGKALQTKQGLESLQIETGTSGFNPMDCDAADCLVDAIKMLPKCEEVSLVLGQGCFDRRSGDARQNLVQLRSKCPQVKKFSWSQPSPISSACHRALPIFSPWRHVTFNNFLPRAEKAKK